MLTALLLTGLSIGLAPMLTHGFYLDDYDLLMVWSRGHTWHFFVPGYPDVSYHYNPVRHLFMSLLHEVAGIEASSYHLLSMCVQLSCVCAWLLLLSELGIRGHWRWPLGAALCFLPFTSEAVFWVGANDQVLGSAAVLWSVYLYLRAARTRKAIDRACSLIPFALGLGIIEFVALVPGLALLLSIGVTETSQVAAPPRRFDRRLLLAQLLLIIAYASMHVLAADPNVITQRERFSLIPGLHNLRNLAIGVEAATAGASSLYDAPLGQTPGLNLRALNNYPFHAICGMLFLAGIAFERTRGAVLCFILTLVPYTLRATAPASSRYYHLPAFMLFLAISRLLDAPPLRVRRWQLGLAFLSIAYAAAGYRTWVRTHSPFYERLGDEAELYRSRLLRQAEHYEGKQRLLVIFNEVPLSICTVTNALVYPLRRIHGQPTYAEKYPRWDEYAKQLSERNTDDEYHLAVGATYDPGKDGCGVYGGGASERCWEVKAPFPGFVSWELSGSSAAAIDAQPNDFPSLVIEELEKEAGAGAPIVVSRLAATLSTSAGRLRIPRPRRNQNWFRITIPAVPGLKDLRVDPI